MALVAQLTRFVSIHDDVMCRFWFLIVSHSCGK